MTANFWLLGRRSAPRRLGGDAMQLDEIAEILRREGAPVHQLQHPSQIHPQRGDKVVLFNLQRCLDWEDLPERSQAAGAALILIPLFHSLGQYHRHGRIGLDGLMARFIQDPQRFAALRWGRADLRARAGQVIALADQILLAHEDEASLMARELGCAPSARQATVVPVAIPATVSLSGQARPPFAGNDFVLCAGRLEPLKNSLSVVRACAALGLPLALAGPLPGVRHLLYQSLLLRELKRQTQVRWLGVLPYAELRHLMGLARVHVLASWAEVVGRSSLEAALSGAAVVASDTGHAAEYLDRSCEGVFLFKPEQEGALEASLAGAWKRGSKADSALVRRVRERFTWDAVEARLLDALSP